MRRPSRRTATSAVTAIERVRAGARVWGEEVKSTEAARSPAMMCSMVLSRSCIRHSSGMNAEHSVHPDLLQVDLTQAGGLLQVVQRDPGGEVVVAEAVADPAQVAVQERRAQAREPHPSTLALRQHAAAPAERAAVVGRQQGVEIEIALRAAREVERDQMA